MFTVRKSFEFCASHELKGLEKGHPCMQIHGHNYEVIIECRSSYVNENGFVLDYRKMEPAKKMFDAAFDHRHLNDFLSFQPSAENLAKHFFTLLEKHIPNLFAVEVCETPKTSARYQPKHY